MTPGEVSQTLEPHLVAASRAFVVQLVTGGVIWKGVSSSLSDRLREGRDSAGPVPRCTQSCTAVSDIQEVVVDRMNFVAAQKD